MAYRLWVSVIAGALLAAGLSGCGDDGRAAVGEPPVAADCSLDALPGSLSAGAWDPRFTIAGVSGQDGIAPKVYAFATDSDGGVLAAGYFRWLGAQRVTPLLRYRDGAWAPALSAADAARLT
ncbi:MAG: hypothetical protein ACREVL_12100, partial [Solimonas sp.]